MATLTKYSSFKALKADAAAKAGNSVESNERHQAFEQFINLLHAQVDKKHAGNADNIPKKRA